jgi:excisionase family DNA binding protein
MTGPQTMTAAAAARRLGVNKSTMTRWIAAGKVPATRTLGGQWSVRATWVDAELTRLGKDREGAVMKAR